MAAHADAVSSTDVRSVAELVRGWRIRAGLTQEQLARSAGLGDRTIRRLESGDLRRPRARSVQQLVDALRLTESQRVQLITAAHANGVPDTHPPAGPVPRQLPATVTGFVGRQMALRALDGLVDTVDGPRTAVIDGTAGVGKTALAVHWAHRVAERFPDGQLYVNLRGFDNRDSMVDPRTVVRGFVDAFAVPPHRIPADQDALVALYRSLLAGRRVLVVLDNARDAEQVRPLLPGGPRCLALVTSRRMLTGLVVADGAHPVHLDLLSTVESRHLLVTRLGAARVAAEPDAVDEIVKRCARLPLALAVAAGRATTRPGALAATAAGLRDAGRCLDGFETGDTVTDVRAVVSWSYRRLRPPAARLFRMLGLHPGPDVGEAAAASLLGTGSRRARASLAELADAQLLIEYTPGRYTCHDLLRAYAEELAAAASRAERTAAHGRMFDHYLHTARAADRALDPHRLSIELTAPRSGTAIEDIADHDAAMAWFAAEERVLLALIDRAELTGYDRSACHLAWTIATYLDRRARWPELARTQSTALAIARRIGDPAAQFQALNLMTRAHMQIGRYDEAIGNLRTAEELAAQLGDTIHKGKIHLNLSALLERAGRAAEALHNGESALDLFRPDGNPALLGRALDRIGSSHLALGDYRQAITYCQRALDFHRDADVRPGAATALMHLGVAHQRLGHFQHAIAIHLEAIELLRQLGDRYFEATALTNLGDTHDAAGNRARAEDSWRRAFALLNGLGHPEEERVSARLRGSRSHLKGIAD